MNCDEVGQQLDAWLDGELSGTTGNALETHLSHCPVCQSRLDQLSDQDRQLRDAFAVSRESSSRVADRVGNQLLLGSMPTVTTSEANRDIARYVQLLTATVAGFLIAMLLFRPWHHADQETPAPAQASPQFGTLSVATGSVEVSPIEAASWSACSSASDVAVGSRLRTGAADVCELSTPDGIMIRLAANTNVSIPTREEVYLDHGRMWCRVPQDQQPLSVKAGGVTVSLAADICDIRQTDGEAELLALEGSIRVQGEGWEEEVPSGHKIRVVRERLMEQSVIGDPVLATRWIHDILIQKGQNDAEFMRIHQLWASLGHAKVQHLYEDELRSMGPSCAAPLAAFLTSPDPQRQNDLRRVQAASILADIASYPSAPQLVELLEDRNPQVRLHAERGLERITGRRFDTIRNAPQKARVPPVGHWRKWLDDRKDRFPDAFRPGNEIAPTTKEA